MKVFEEVIANTLREIYDSPGLAPKSRACIEEWLALGGKWALVDELERLIQVAEEAGITTGQLMTRLAFELDTEPIPQVQDRFFRQVPLPAGLTIEHLREAMCQTQRMIPRINRSLRFGTDLPLIHFIQATVSVA